MWDKFEDRLMDGILAVCILGLIGVFTLVSITIPPLAVLIVLILLLAYLLGYIIERIKQRRK